MESIGISSLSMPISHLSTLKHWTELHSSESSWSVIFPRISLRGCIVNKKTDISSVSHSPYISHTPWGWKNESKHRGKKRI